MIIVQTNNSTKVATICPGDDVASIVDAGIVHHGGFNMTNTAKGATMKKLREAAAAEGLKLRDVKTMAVG